MKPQPSREHHRTSLHIPKIAAPSLPSLFKGLAAQDVPKGRVFLLFGLLELLTIGIVAIPLVIVSNPLIYYQGLLMIITPLAVASLGFAFFSLYLTLSLLRASSNNTRTSDIPHSPSYQPSPYSDPYHDGDLAGEAAAESIHLPQQEQQIFHIGALQAASEHDLTKRESEVLELLLQGRNAERISQILVISKHTAKSHIYNTYRKIGVSSQQELLDMFQRKTLDQKELSYAWPDSR